MIQQQPMPMMAAQTAQNPAAQQMLAQFMNGAGGQSIVPQKANDVQVTKSGHPWTIGNFYNDLTKNQRLLMDPRKQLKFAEESKQNQTNDFKDAGFFNIGAMRKTDVTDTPTNGLQNNAPKIDWSSLLNQQPQAQIQQPKPVQML